MSLAKIVLLVIYVVLCALALIQPDSVVGIWSLRLLLLLAVVHFIETLLYFRLCREAGGSLPVHLLSVFLFGVLHVNELKSKRAAS